MHWIFPANTKLPVIFIAIPASIFEQSAESISTFAYTSTSAPSMYIHTAHELIYKSFHVYLIINAMAMPKCEMQFKFYA